MPTEIIFKKVNIHKSMITSIFIKFFFKASVVDILNE